MMVPLAAFVQMHNALHNSLGLAKLTNKRVRTLSGLLILKSGHGLPVTHLRPHGRCLTEADPEGAPVNWRFGRVLWQGPWHTLMLRRESLRMAPHTRHIQLLETALTLVLLGAFVGLYWATGSLVGLVYWAVAFGMSATMPIRASYVPPHVSLRNPVGRAAAVAQAWTLLTASFAFYHLHHCYPRAPTALLYRVAELPPPPQDHPH